MLHNIPAELQRLPQWVVADMSLNHEGKPKKTPLNPRTGESADVTIPSTWGTFTEAKSTGAKCIGFVLAASDPYTIIDLDQPTTDEQVARHSAILAATSSYAEYSQSGNGVHIILRGGVPHGVRRDKVEIYSSARYMICTGDVLRQAPIVDGQGLLDTLFAEMASTEVSELVDVPETQTDEAIMDMALTAVNGHKCAQLVAGHWEGNPLWPSQSEADFALMAMLAFYSRSNEQCRRLFRSSALGQRDKAQRDKYLDYMLSKIRAKTPPEPDFSLILKQANEIAQQITVQSNDNRREADALQSAGARKGPPDRRYNGLEQHDGHKAKGPPPRSEGKPTFKGREAAGNPLPYPPGLFGDIARYFQGSAIRPVQEISIITALGLGSGVCGRSYNISSTGLNQYLILLARTGSGKEGVANCISRLVAATRQIVPMADQFVGPGAFASGQGLVRTLDTKPCFVSVLGEIGLTLKSICDPRADKNADITKRVWLDLYNKSGFQDILRPSVYSDNEKNTKLVQAPCVTLLGESTPETFYGNLDHGHILDGLIPRFSVIEYNGPRPARNHQAFEPPSESLVSQFADLVTVALTCQANSTCHPVQMEPDAKALLDAFDVHSDDQINGTGSEVERHLWNRAHLKALKLSALLAVGKAHENPIVDRECAEWAIMFVTREVNGMVTRFKDGDVGGGESKQEADLRRAVAEYLVLDEKGYKNYKIPAKLQGQPLVPYHYLRRRLKLISSFKNDRRGHNVALDAMLEAMVKSQALKLLSPRLAAESYDVTAPLYALGATWGI